MDANASSCATARPTTMISVTRANSVRGSQRRHAPRPVSGVGLGSAGMAGIRWGLWAVAASGERDLDADVAARGLRVRAGLVRGVHHRLRHIAVEARQADAQA